MDAERSRMKQRIRGVPPVPFRAKSGENLSATITADIQRSRNRSHSRKHSNVGLPSPVDRISCLIVNCCTQSRNFEIHANSFIRLPSGT